MVGVGPVTAKKLLDEYDTLEGFITAAEEGKVRLRWLFPWWVAASQYQSCVIPSAISTNGWYHTSYLYRCPWTYRRKFSPRRTTFCK